MGSLLENDVTIRPLIAATAPPDIPPPSSSNQGQLANLVLDTAAAGVSSQPKPRGKKYHRRGKERRFGRGFRLIRNKHPFAEDFQVESPSSSPSSSVSVLPTAPTAGPLQPSASPSPPPQFANQVLSLDSTGSTGQQQLLTANITSTTSIPVVNTFDNQISGSADQTEVKNREH